MASTQIYVESFLFFGHTLSTQEVVPIAVDFRLQARSDIIHCINVMHTVRLVSQTSLIKVVGDAEEDGT